MKDLWGAVIFGIGLALGIAAYHFFIKDFLAKGIAGTEPIQTVLGTYYPGVGPEGEAIWRRPGTGGALVE